MSPGTPGPVHLDISLYECMWLLRTLRAVKKHIQEDMLAIEERIRGGNDGQLTDAHRLLDSDCTTVDSLIRRLWQVCGS